MRTMPGLDGSAGQGVGATGTALARWRDRSFRAGRLSDLGLIAVGLWSLSQLVPLVPSLDVGELRHGLAPLWGTLRQPDRFDFSAWGAYAANIAGLALLARTLVKPGRPVNLPFFGFVVCVLLLKVPVMVRQLSLEALAGALAAAILAAPTSGMRLKATSRVAAFFVLAGFVIAELARTPSGTRHAFAWVPFSAQLENPLIGMGSILENIWPAAALAYLVRFATPLPRRGLVAWIGGAGLGALAFGLEWYQQFLPGRIGDITTAMLMILTWGVCWAIPVPEILPAARERGRQASHGSPRASRTVMWVLILVAAAGAIGAAVGYRPPERRVDESKLPELPTPSELPPAKLPSFRIMHPRLPSPSPAELATLKAYSHDFLREVRRDADGGKGNLYRAALEALLEPGSVDLNLLFSRLTALKFAWRGHEQVKPLAVAYDWL